MYVYLVYLLRAEIPAGDAQTYVHFQFLFLWVKGSHCYFIYLFFLTKYLQAFNYWLHWMMTITKKRNASSFLNTFVDLFQVNLILFKGNPLSTESLWKSRIRNVSVLQFDWLAGFIEEEAVNFAFTVQWSVQHSGTLIPSIQVSLELFAVTLRSCCTLSTPLYVLFLSLKLLSWDLFSH